MARGSRLAVRGSMRSCCAARSADRGPSIPDRGPWSADRGARYVWRGERKAGRGMFHFLKDTKNPALGGVDWIGFNNQA